MFNLTDLSIGLSHLNFSIPIVNNALNLRYNDSSFSFFDNPPPPFYPAKPTSGLFELLDSPWFNALSRWVAEKVMDMYFSTLNAATTKSSSFSLLNGKVDLLELFRTHISDTYAVYPVVDGGTINDQLTEWVNESGIEDTQKQSRQKAMVKMLDCFQKKEKSLILAGSSITSLPECIGSFTHLELIDISWSGLRTLPDSFGNLTNLKSLNLNPSQIVSIPESFGNLTSLIELKLSTSHLTSLPNSFTNLTRLSVLDLSSHARFIGPLVLPDNFGHLTNLTWLNLNGNNLTSLPKSFNQLTSLRYLQIDLSNNLPVAEEKRALEQVKKQLEVLGPLKTNFELEALKNPPAETVPDDLKAKLNQWSQASGLTEKETEGRQIAQSKILSCYGKKEASLNLQSLNLTALPDCIGNFTGIVELDVSSNELTKLPDTICLLTNLKKIRASQNKLQRLPIDIGKLKNLISLDLSKNQLQTLPDNFCKLTNLGKREHPNRISPNSGVNLSHNQLRFLPENFGDLENLEELDLADNQLQTLPFSIGKLSKLFSLVLTKNQIHSLPDSLCNLTSLIGLDLSENRLKALPMQIGNLFWTLKQLLVNKNQLETLPEDMGRLVLLDKLDISDNQLKQLPNSFCNLYHLRLLKLSNNQLTELPAGFGNLLNLKGLDLVNNQLQVLPDSMAALKNLRVLSLNGNSIQTLPRALSLTLKGLFHESRPQQPGEALPRLETMEDLETFVSLADSVAERGSRTLTASRRFQEQAAPKMDARVVRTQLTQWGSEEAISEMEKKARQIAIPKIWSCFEASAPSLDLSNLNLTALPQCFEELSELVECHLQNNQLTGLPQNLSKLQKLRIWNLSNNLLTSLPDSILDLNLGVIINLNGHRLPKQAIQHLDALIKRRRSANGQWGPLDPRWFFLMPKPSGCSIS